MCTFRIRSNHLPLAAAVLLAVSFVNVPALGTGGDGTRVASFMAAADVFGGYDSSYILLRLEPGLDPAESGTGVNVDNGPIDALAGAWGATAIQPFLGMPAQNQGLAERYGLNRTYRLLVPRGSDTPTMATQFAGLPGVELAEVDGVGGIAETIPDDPGFWQLWGMNNTGQSGGTPDADIDAPEAWDIHTGSADVIIAILDTGVQADHPDLDGKVISGWNTYDNNADTSDPHGHGTHTSGTAAAIGDNGTFFTGVNWYAQILAMTVVNDIGTGNESHCAAGIVYATDFGVDVISMSLQYYSGTQTLRSAVLYAEAAGVLQIAANGNNMGNVVAYPAKFPSCMAVGGTDRMDAWYTLANYGPETDVSAPAKEIVSLWKDSSFNTRSGTSMATPHVSGLASLIMSYNHAKSPAQIRDILVATVDDLGPAGFDEKFGWGRINAHAAMLIADPHGDMNCDGAFNGADIDPFFLALGDMGAYELAYPGCEGAVRGDMNGDSAFNGADIDAFFTALGGG